MDLSGGENDLSGSMDDLGPMDDLTGSVAMDLTAPIQSTDGGCTAGGAMCTSNAACCSGLCDGTTKTCTTAQCAGPGGGCKTGTDCCNGNCVGTTCASTQCLADNATCTVGGTTCCSTQCVSGKCAPLCPTCTCKTFGNPCATAAECCSQLCTGGFCAAPGNVSYCHQPNDICSSDNECCTGVCVKTGTNTVGTCATIQTSCNVDGTVCSGCTGCCSSFCAPFGSSGTRICQPASGCHVLGDLCHKNSDCCGGPPNAGLPGEGEVVCVADPNYPQIGVCSVPNKTNCVTNPNDPLCHNTCIPEGDVCHYKNNGGCSVNSINNNCCGAPGNSGVCKLDTLGVPRCYGLGMCVMPGGNCAASSDCCNNFPCIPDSNGVLKCLEPPDGGPACVPQGQTCTTTADCCTGFQCVVPPGSLSGTCTQPPPPPNADMAQPPPDLAGVDLFGVDLAQTPRDMAQPPPMCALYGQSCSTTVGCCAGEGSCLTPFASGSNPCPAGETDCTCYTPLM
jgi:hypothetical protein